MDNETEQLIRAIHESSWQVMMVTAGAGTTALSKLLIVPGASTTLLEAVVPYSENAFYDFLGAIPHKFVAADTARKLAGRALVRGNVLADRAHSVLGLACTATITTTRPKRGKHRAFVAYWTPSSLGLYRLLLEKGAKNRAEEETLIGLLILNALADGIGLDENLPLPLGAHDQLEKEIVDIAGFVRQLVANEIEHFGLTADGRILTTLPRTILAGAFNPLHQGHIELAQAAGKKLNAPVVFECTAINVDKPPLAPDTIQARLAQFAGQWPVIASNAPTFLQKSRFFPGATFIVGYDTAVRLLEPRYYQNNIEQRNAALAEIKQNGNRFMVAGRVDKAGSFRDLLDLDIPDEYTSLFQSLPGFRLDISSTAIRESQTKNRFRQK